MIAGSNARVSILGGLYPRREQKALQLFNEVSQWYAQLKQKGEIDSYETIGFDDFNADFGGLTILRADPHKLIRLSQTDEAVSFGRRAELLLRHYRALRGFTGDNLQSRMANLVKQIDLLK